MQAPISNGAAATSQVRQRPSTASSSQNGCISPAVQAPISNGAAATSQVRQRPSTASSSQNGSISPAVQAPFRNRAAATSQVRPSTSTSSLDSSQPPSTPTHSNLPINSSLRNLRQLPGNILLKFQMHLLKINMWPF